MSKFYQVKMSNGETWQVPVSLILDDMREYYNEDVDSPVACEDDIVDWAQNNMNWSDVKDCAELVESDIDYEDYWCNGEGQIV